MAVWRVCRWAEQKDQRKADQWAESWGTWTAALKGTKWVDSMACQRVA